jgi:hypothetical protein
MFKKYIFVLSLCVLSVCITAVLSLTVAANGREVESVESLKSKLKKQVKEVDSFQDYPVTKDPVINLFMQTGSAQSVCNGLAINATQPTQFTPPTPNQNAPAQIENVNYWQSFPIQTNGTVQYISRLNDSAGAQAIAQALTVEVEWMELCTNGIQSPTWDPGSYPANNMPADFWDMNHLRTCIYDMSPLSSANVLGRAWNLETGQCEEVMAPVPPIQQVSPCLQHGITNWPNYSFGNSNWFGTALQYPNGCGIQAVMYSNLNSPVCDPVNNIFIASNLIFNPNGSQVNCLACYNLPATNVNVDFSIYSWLDDVCVPF